MALDFTKCEQCGIIFANPDSQQQLCPKCRHEAPQTISTREQLRLVKNELRDQQAQGCFLTVEELSEHTGVEQSTIWHFIHSGEIDTASFNDPGVRDFIVKRRKERMKAALGTAQEHDEKPAVDQAARVKSSGFHIKVDNDREK